jgi:hypothetical protein
MQPTRLVFNVFMQGNAPGTLYLDDFEFSYGPSGIEETDVNAFQLYPNPTNTNAVIAASATKAFAYSVTDATGRLVEHRRLVNGHGLVEHFAAGFYTVTVEDRSGHVLQRRKLVSQ